MGLKVNWVSFDTGVAMSAAMASGDVHIAYSQGLVPFANAVTAGLPLKTVGIAMSYAENDNCVVGTDTGIGALQRGDVAMSCGWGGALLRMKENGDILMTGAEMQEIGILVFDVVSVTEDFAANHGDIITQFLQVTEDANAAYAEDAASKHETIAEAAGMEVDAAIANLDTFTFLTAEEQMSEAWMGGTVQKFVQEVAEFFVEQGELDAALDDYAPFIDTSFLEAVN